MSDIHLEIFPEAQQRVWEELVDRADKLDALNFYLAGGSSLALQIGHRQSVDLDFFTQDKDIAERVFGWLREIPGFTAREMNAHTIHGDIGGVKISVIGGYKYPLLEDTVLVGGLRLASMRDIGAMKLLAITHRAALRDYIDIAVIIRDYFSLEALLEASVKKHGAAFDAMIPLRALVAFEDIDSEMPRLLDTTLADSWQKIITDAVKQCAGKA